MFSSVSRTAASVDVDEIEQSDGVRIRLTRLASASIRSSLSWKPSRRLNPFVDSDLWQEKRKGCQVLAVEVPKIDLREKLKQIPKYFNAITESRE